MILISGILMSSGIKRLNRFFSNRVSFKKHQIINKQTNIFAVRIDITGLCIALEVVGG